MKLNKKLSSSFIIKSDFFFSSAKRQCLGQDASVQGQTTVSTILNQSFNRCLCSNLIVEPCLQKPDAIFAAVSSYEKEINNFLKIRSPNPYDQVSSFFRSTLSTTRDLLFFLPILLLSCRPLLANWLVLAADRSPSAACCGCAPLLLFCLFLWSCTFSVSWLHCVLQLWPIITVVCPAKAHTQWTTQVVVLFRRVQFV